MTENAFERKPVNPDESPVGAPEVRTVAEPAPVDADPNSFTHYVWLADGRVIRANLPGHSDVLGSRHYEMDGDVEVSVPIVGVYSR